MIEVPNPSPPAARSAEKATPPQITQRDLKRTLDSASVQGLKKDIDASAIKAKENKQAAKRAAQAVKAALAVEPGKGADAKAKAEKKQKAKAKAKQQATAKVKASKESKAKAKADVLKDLEHNMVKTCKCLLLHDSHYRMPFRQRTTKRTLVCLLYNVFK